MNFFFFFFILLLMMSVLSFLSFLYFLKLNFSIFFEWEILLLNSNYIEMIMYFDWMSLLFLSVVFFISSFVSLYSMEYMNKKKNQFILLIFLFVMSMMLFIISPNIISILIGWDGLGLVSFILIVFFQSNKSKNSGMQTILLNRVGDVMIILASWFFYLIGGMNFLYFYDFSMKLGMTMIILASMTKSAQMPFSSWLPAAMAAPTPVSSLVHSSTLVTAGIYLMMRFNNYIMQCEMMMKLLFIIGTITMFMAGVGANFENDLKKIIALSTLSQLGLMMLTLSFGLMNFSFFHLTTHALFKALLFLCAGVMIHNYKDIQDIRVLSYMVYYLPITTMCFNMANLSLCGFPFLSGFYSKDLIIEMIIISEKNAIFFILCMISTSLTVSYTFRLLYYLSFSKKMYFCMMNKSESKIFNFVLINLTFFSIISGITLNWLLNSFFNEMILSKYYKMIIPIILFKGLILSFFFIKMKKMAFFSSLWYLNFIILSFKKMPLFFGEKMFFSSNLGFFEYFGGQGLKKIIMLYPLNKNFFLSIKKTLNFSIFFFLWMFYL
nr:NADH dehydrogenase subunit 5 [Megathrips lativentris]